MHQLHDLQTQNFNSSIEIDEKFFIKNIDTGESYDSRNDDSYRKICEKLYPNKLNFTEKAWQDFWKEVRRTRENLWNYAETGKEEQLLQLIKTFQNSFYPIDINERTLNKWAALHFAAEENHFRIIALLLENGAHIEAQTSFGRTALHLASRKKNIDAMKILIEKGANIDAIDQEMNTPLHLAAETSSNSSISLLLLRHPCLTIKNYQGMTAYNLCSNVKARKLFEEYGEDGEESYGRTFIGDIILNNSRADHVEKFLFLGVKNKKSIVTNIFDHQEEDLNKIDLSIFKDNSNKTNPKTKKYEADLENIEESKEEEIEKKEALPTSSSYKKPALLEESKVKLSEKNFEKIEKERVPSLKKTLKNLLKFFGGKNGLTKENLLEKKMTHSDFIYYSLIGKGSFGEVYLVKHRESDKFFAMKVLAKEKVLSQNLIKYVQSERNILSLMSHPFIVRLYHAFQNERKLFLILEYCPGGDLGKSLMRHRRFSEEVTRIYTAEIILGIEALHAKNILFRDLKPDNVVLDSEGHALLTDFGLSKQGTEDSLSKSFCGSIAYLAPEMLAKVGHNKSIDWYLVGVLFYELLVGIPPFFSKNRDEMFNNIRSGPLLIPKNLSPEAKDLMKKLLIRNPKNRMGAKNGAEEIKAHEFFQGINWKYVYERKCKPPPPEFRDFDKIPMDIDPFSLDSPLLKETKKRNDSKYIEGWSYQDIAIQLN